MACQRFDPLAGAGAQIGRWGRMTEMDKVWKLKAFDSELSEWRCFDIGSDELLGEMIEKLLRWKGEGQQVRLEWSERN